MLVTANPFGEFSNFHRAPIVIDGQTYDTTEVMQHVQTYCGSDSQHYFQAMKFKGTPYERVVHFASCLLAFAVYPILTVPSAQAVQVPGEQQKTPNCGRLGQ